MSESTMDKTAEAKDVTAEAQSGAAGENSAPKASRVKTEIVDAAVMAGDELGPVIASGPNLGISTKMRAKFFDGTGKGSVVPFDRIRITVRFPHEGCSYSFEKASMPVFDRFPDAKRREKGLTVIRISLADEARVTVTGFGMPFANADDAQVAGWINENKPIAGDSALLGFLRQRIFFVTVPLPVHVASKIFSADRLLPFAYPYGTVQDWDVSRFKDLIKANKGQQFDAAYSHDDDNHHMTAVNQSNVQDVMWLDDAAIEIAATKFPAYFVRPESRAPTADTDRFHVVVAMRDGFRKVYKAAWRRLSKTESFLLHLYDDPEGTEPDAKWECKIVDHPALEHHETAKHELVLLVRRPERADMNPDYVVKDFGDRAEANDALKQGSERWHHVGLCFDAGLLDCKRKVEAVSLFHPLADPSNPLRWGLPDPNVSAEKRRALTGGQVKTLAQVKDRMMLHRALVRGNGFYDWMVGAPKSEATCRPLPSVNYLEFDDDVRAEAIVNEALPQDRVRFRAYLSSRPLGLGIIAAGPGTGKTTAGAAATAAMVEKVGRVLCSAPTYVAVANFAARLDQRTRAMAEACNQGKEQNDPKRYRHRLVIRAYKPAAEVGAFNALLKNPTLGDEAAPKGWGHASQWKLHLSLAFWLLVILGSPAVRELHPDDCQVLWDLRREVDKWPEMRRLRDVATGVTTWEQYEQEGSVANKRIEVSMLRLLPIANMLCITPAASENVKEYRAWKTVAENA
ncbi:hypothetical protein J3F83DRAFT_767824 [Trichoderma novae-zelandiae]